METEKNYSLTEEDKIVPDVKYECKLCLHGYDARFHNRFLCMPHSCQTIKLVDLDHTADVQIHAWGHDLGEAFEQCALAMFAYMTDIQTVEITDYEDITVDGDDMESLLYKFLDEWLFNFCAEPNFIARKVKILEFDKENYRIKARGFGETFDLDKHPQETEVKAITYSAMQIHEKEVFVIIDI